MKGLAFAVIGLNDWVFPRGRKELRIIQPQLMKLISRYYQSNTMIALGVQRDNSSLPLYRSATLVKIVDFHELQDGCLSVVFEGQSRVEIDSVEEGDGYWLAKGVALQEWGTSPMDDQARTLAHALQKFYEENPEISELYTEIDLNNSNWVSQRWLEVLPVYNDDKQKLISRPDGEELKHFVYDIVCNKLTDEVSNKPNR